MWHFDRRGLAVGERKQHVPFTEQQPVDTHGRVCLMNGLNEVVGGCRLSFINIGDGGGGYGKFVGKLHLREMKVLHDLSYAVFHAGVIFFEGDGWTVVEGVGCAEERSAASMGQGPAFAFRSGARWMIGR